jgi:hypothetical protein
VGNLAAAPDLCGLIFFHMRSRSQELIAAVGRESGFVADGIARARGCANKNRRANSRTSSVTLQLRHGY